MLCSLKLLLVANKFADRTECGNGHPYVEGSWAWRKDGTGRACKVCHRENARRSRANQKKVGYAREQRKSCVNGHRYVEGSYITDQRGWRKCLTCYKARNDSRDKTEKQKSDARYRFRRRFGVTLETNGGDYDWDDLLTARQRKAENSPNAAWNMLKPQATDELHDFLEAMQDGRTKCFGDDSFTEYDDPRWPDESTGLPFPNRYIAEEKCAGCPFFAQCDVWSKVEKPAWGVYAGRVWIDGQVVNNVREVTGGRSV